MCLAIPGRLIKKKDSETGVVDLGGVTKEISLVFLPDIREGEWLIIHTGFALERISEQEALDTISLLQSAYGKSNK
jgi:hydrogenase expression/formation protein HypC